MPIFVKIFYYKILLSIIKLKYFNFAVYYKVKIFYYKILLSIIKLKYFNFNFNFGGF